MIERIENLDGFEKLRDEWNALLRASSNDVPFLTWEWLSTWWRHLGGNRKLSLLTLRRGGELAAIAPLMIAPPRFSRLAPFSRLEFLGTGSIGSDYLDFIVRQDQEPEALDAFSESLAGRKLMLELGQVRTESSFAARLAGRLCGAGWHLQERPAGLCPFVSLKGHTWDSYLASLGSEHRYNFRKRLRHLAGRFRLEQAESETARREALQELFRLHHLRWQARGGSEAFHLAGLLAFHEDFSRLALERGWLRLFLLRLDGKPAAALYGFRYGKSFYFYQSGFDPACSKLGVGLVMMGLAIRAALEEGAGEYDLLHGDEPYKFLWANHSRSLQKLELYPPNVLGSLYRQAAVLGRAARGLARRVLPETVAKNIARSIESRA